MADETLTTIAIVNILCLYAICCPLSIYWIVSIYHFRESMIMRKRYIMASIWSSIAAICLLLISKPATFLISLYESTHHENVIFRVLSCFDTIFYTFSIQGVIYGILYRFWMIYFEFVYCWVLHNEEWTLQINPKGNTPRQRWIIEHRKDYGNPKWIKKRILSIYIASTLISTILLWLSNFNLFDYTTALYIDSLLFIFPLICKFILWYKIPHFLDSFNVRNELKLIVIIYIIGLILNVVIITAIGIFNDTLKKWEATMVNILAVFVFGSIIFIQTKYVLMAELEELVNFQQSNDDLVRTTTPSHSVTSATAPSIRSRVESCSNYLDSPRTPKKKTYKLCDVLQDQKLFILFVQHLISEISSECLFAYIELTQFKTLLESDPEFMVQVNTFKNQFIYTEKTEQQIREQNICKFMISKPGHISSADSYDRVILLDQKTIPLSYIVHEQFTSKEYVKKYKLITIALANKYIEEDADLSINIGYKTRSDIIAWVDKHCYHNISDTAKEDFNNPYESTYNNMKKQFKLQQFCEMYYLFEACRKEMYNLMKHTLKRFIKTNEFMEYTNLYPTTKTLTTVVEDTPRDVDDNAIEFGLQYLDQIKIEPI